MNVICLISFRPHAVWCDLLNHFSRYVVYIVVDDNEFDLSDFEASYKNIRFIKLDKNTCRSRGFRGVNFMVKKNISGWDKALCYFAINGRTDDLIWFIEDDVFFYGESTLADIDERHKNCDLISRACSINKDGNRDEWHWARIEIHYDPPYYFGMMCAVRISGAMMKAINEYAASQRRLFFLEALFPTIAAKNGLKHCTPSELGNIFYRKEITTVDAKNLFHPVKDLKMHADFRR